MVIFIDQKVPDEGLHSTYIKINPENIEETLKFIGQKWKELVPAYPFEYKILKDRISENYEFPRKLLQIFNIFAFLCIFISCLGLFGLSSFMTERRTKEIGIRKVHGASVIGILIRITLSFLMLILRADIIASIMSYFIAKEAGDVWINSPEINMWVINIVVMCIVVSIALLTVSYHAVKAALTDPVKTLRYE